MSVSVHDVATAAGVSVGTVSNVLNRPHKVAPETVARVQAAIDRLGYIRNDAARQLRVGHSRTIGLVIPDLRNPFFTEMARGVEARCASHGLSVLFAHSEDDPAREAAQLELFEEQRARGVLITPVALDLPRLRRMCDRGVPVVLVAESHGANLVSVSVDDVEGGRLAVEHLLSIGRRRIAFVGGPTSFRQISDRLTGAYRAAAAGGATLELIGTDGPTVEEGHRAGDRILQRPAGARPDAIFAANDLLALGLLKSLVMTGAVRIPDEIALIGYDDIDFAKTALVPLSSIRQPAALLGSTAVDLLLAQLDTGRKPVESVVFQPELIVRASSG